MHRHEHRESPRALPVFSSVAAHGSGNRVESADRSGAVTPPVNERSPNRADARSGLGETRTEVSAGRPLAVVIMLAQVLG